MNFLNILQPTTKPSVQKPTNPTETHVEVRAKVKEKPQTMTTKDGKTTPKKKTKEPAKYQSPTRQARQENIKKQREKQAKIKDNKGKKSPTKKNNDIIEDSNKTKHSNNQTNTPNKDQGNQPVRVVSDQKKILVQGRIKVLSSGKEVKIKQEQIDMVLSPTVKNSETEALQQLDGNRIDNENNMQIDKPQDNKPTNKVTPKRTTIDIQTKRKMEIDFDQEKESSEMEVDDEPKGSNITIGSTAKAQKNIHGTGDIITFSNDSDDSEDEDMASQTYKSAVTKDAGSYLLKQQEKPTQQQRLAELESKGFKQAAAVQCFRKYYTRFQIVVAAPDNPAAKESFYKSNLGELINVIRSKGCPKAVLLPYLNKDAGKAHITTKKD